MNRTQADSIVFKTGVLAMMYYPELIVDDPAFKLANDVTWCLDEAGEISESDLELIRDVVGRTIIDPTLNRESLTELVYSLVPGE